LLKAEFDQYRIKQQLHPLLSEYGFEGSLFQDLNLLNKWRDYKQGARWTSESGDILLCVFDDVLVLPEGTLAILDYKSTGSRYPKIYPSYQLQMDIYSFMIDKLKYPISGKAFFAFFQVVRDKGFMNRLPFRGLIIEVKTSISHVEDLFNRACILARKKDIPQSGPSCDLCRWQRQTSLIKSKDIKIKQAIEKKKPKSSSLPARDFNFNS